MAKTKYWEGIGRRKETTARVRIYQDTKNIKTWVNKKDLKDFFNKIEIDYIKAPLKITEQLGKFVFTVVVKGGGRTGWKDAIRLGLARALVKFNNDFKPALRKAGMLTRDARAVERKKAGLKKARKAPRFSKR